MKKQLLTGAIILGLIGCTTDEDNSSAGNSTNPIQNEKSAKALSDYTKLVSKTYDQSLTDGKNLQKAILAFTADPNEQKLQSAKEAWLTSRESYGQSEVFRFYEGPIDNEKNGGPEGQLNAWPLDEAYIDYVLMPDTESDQLVRLESGLISDDGFQITKENLKAQNEAGGEANIATGYHAIEFLLWGQDLNSDDEGATAYIIEGKANTGSREITDYTTDDQASRRITYLEKVTEILVEDLEFLTSEWKAAETGYRKDFLALEAQEGFSNILTGMGFLAKGELSGERMRVALENHDQEDEHSCFSDNTHRDIVTNFLGIYNVYYGVFGNFEGVGIRELLSSDLQATTDSAFENTKEALEAIQAPFDSEISTSNPEGNQRVQAGIDALGALSDQIVEIALAMEIKNLSVED